MTSYRLKPEHRKQLILSGAIRLADRLGYRNITLPEIAVETRCVASLISHYFGTIENLRDEVLREAIRRDHVRIVAQGISHLDPIAADAPLRLRRQAAKLMMTGGV